MKSDLLKALALKAKNRLINRNAKETNKTSSVKIITDNDEEFYQKVKSVSC